MLIEQTLEKLYTMKWGGMAQGLKDQMGDPNMSELSFEDRLGFLVDQQWMWRENRSLHARIQKAGFKCQACMEDIDYRTHRGLNKAALASLTQANWIQQCQSTIITGPTGVGKTYLACAIGQRACRNGFKVLYYYAPKLFRELKIATAEGDLGKLFRKLLKTELLIIDDWGMEKLSDQQYRDLLEILDDRQEVAATLFTSQFPIEQWHDNIGNPTLADAILDRIIHNAHQIKLKGESMRKLKNKKS